MLLLVSTQHDGLVYSVQARHFASSNHCTFTLSKYRYKIVYKVLTYFNLIDVGDGWEEYGQKHIDESQ